MRWQLLFALLLGAAASACSSVSPFQTGHSVRVRVGNHEAVERQLEDVAPLVVDYATLALETYQDHRYQQGRARHAIDVRRVPGGGGDARIARLGRVAMARWSFVGALINECGDQLTARRDFGFAGEKGSCLSSDSPRGRILDGLGVQIWTRGKPGGSFCAEAVIAFRGTDARQADDWLTNFRTITRVLPLYDQYAQVQDHIPAVINRVEALPCYRRGRTKLIAVGHSLGGGLAQQAAYRDRRIRHVYAFDPSFVTGFYDLPPDIREGNARGLKIDRVYEHGEILAYPRLLLRNIYPPTPCHPQIRHIRFNVQHGGTIVSQHSMVRFAEELLRHSDRTRSRSTAAAGLAHLPVSDLPECVQGDRLT